MNYYQSNSLINCSMMFFLIQCFHEKTGFHIAVEKGNIEMIQALLNCERIEANIKSILN